MLLFCFNICITYFTGAGGGGISSGGDGVEGRYSSGQEQHVTYTGQHFIAAGDKFSITCVLDINEHLQWTFNRRPIVPGEAG